MKPSFDVTADVARSLLTIRLDGFFDVPTVQALAAARDAAVAKLRCGPNQHVTLCDARLGKLSTKEVAGEFERLLGDPRYRSRKLAYLTDGALARLQAARVLDRTDIAFFDDEVEAVAWLFQ